MVGQSWSFGAYAQAGHIIYNRLCVFPCWNIVCWVPYLVNNSKSSLNLHLPQSIESTLGIHVACLSPAKTRQHHAHPLWIKKERKLWYIHGVHEILLIFCNPNRKKEKDEKTHRLHHQGIQLFSCHSMTWQQQVRPTRKSRKMNIKMTNCKSSC